MEKGIIVHTIVYNENKEILLLQRSESNDTLPLYWDIPGGTLEDGEDPKIGALRELKEETSLDIPEPKLFFVYSNIDESKNKQFITLIFYSKYTGGEVKLSEDEHVNYKWLNVDEFKNIKGVNYLEKCIKEIRSRNLI